MLLWASGFHFAMRLTPSWCPMNSRLDQPKKPLLNPLQSIGAPGHDPTKLIMIPTVERLGLFQTRKQTHNMSGYGYTKLDQSSCLSLILSSLENNVPLYLVFVSSGYWHWWYICSLLFCIGLPPSLSFDDYEYVRLSFIPSSHFLTFLSIPSTQPCDIWEKLF